MMYELGLSDTLQLIGLTRDSSSNKFLPNCDLKNITYFILYQGIYERKWPKFTDDYCLFLSCQAIKSKTSFNSASSSFDFDEKISKSPDLNDMFQ